MQLVKTFSWLQRKRENSVENVSCLKIICKFFSFTAKFLVLLNIGFLHFSSISLVWSWSNSQSTSLFQLELLLFDFPPSLQMEKPTFQHFTSLEEISSNWKTMWLNNFEGSFRLKYVGVGWWRAIKKSVSRNWSKVEIARTQLWQRFPIARIPFLFSPHERVKVTIWWAFVPS